MGAGWNCEKCGAYNMGSHCDCTSQEVRELEARIKELLDEEAAMTEIVKEGELQTALEKITELEAALDFNKSPIDGEWGPGHPIFEMAEDNDRLNARIRELEEGSCRFNCRTMKEAFMAGWDASLAVNDPLELDEVYMASQAYKSWLKERDNG